MENFHKYHKIKQLGDEENKDIFLVPTDQIAIEEKVDGANFRFIIKDVKIIFGSRTQQLTSDEGEETNISKNFQRCVKHILETVWSNIDITESPLFKSLIFYGENMVKHTMNYDWEKMPPFLGFDIYNLKEEKYLTYNEVKETYDKLGLDMVPIIKICNASEITEVNDELVPTSIYAPISNPKQQAEGIVFKNYDKQIFAKYVRNEFKERNLETFGGNPKYNKEGEFDNDKILFKYCTNARIDKIIFKLIDSGEEFHMKLMNQLPTTVYNDIMEEEWREITLKKNHYKIDFRKFNKQVTKRCLFVLQQTITNNALQ